MCPPTTSRIGRLPVSLGGACTVLAACMDLSGYHLADETGSSAGASGQVQATPQGGLAGMVDGTGSASGDVGGVGGWRAGTGGARAVGGERGSSGGTGGAPATEGGAGDGTNGGVAGEGGASSGGAGTAGGEAGGLSGAVWAGSGGGGGGGAGGGAGAGAGAGAGGSPGWAGYAGTALGSAGAGADAGGAAGSSVTTPVDPRTQVPGPPDPNAPYACLEVGAASIPTTYCHVQNNGYDSMGNPQADVGDTSVWIYWSSDAVDGWICVVDDQANGRGLNYRVLGHRWGTEATMPEGAFISSADSFQEVAWGTGQGSCGWGSFSGTVSGGVDFLVVEWEDAWVSSADVPTTHYDGRVTAESPWY